MPYGTGGMRYRQGLKFFIQEYSSASFSVMNEKDFQIAFNLSRVEEYVKILFSWTLRGKSECDIAKESLTRA
jgi:phosphopantetheinyl transferase